MSRPVLAGRAVLDRLQAQAPALALLGVFLVALGARWGYAWLAPAGSQISAVDAQGYHTLALNLLNGRGFSLSSAPPFVPDAIRTPLYPLLVAALYALAGPYPVAVALAQGLLDAGTAVGLAAAAAHLLHNRRLGLLAGGLYALNPTAWRFANEVLTETLLAALLMLLVWAFVHYARHGPWRWLLLSAALAGLAVLVKPNAVLIPIILATAVAVQSRRLPGAAWRRALSHSALVLVVAGAVLLPWLFRNRLVYGRWFLSHAFENNLARVSAVATLVQLGGEPVAPWTPRWEAIYSGLLLAAEARYGADFDPVPRTAVEADQLHRQLAVVAGEIVRGHPRAFLAAHLSGFLRSWVPQEHRYWYGLLAGSSWESLGSAEGVLGQALNRWRREGLGAALAFAWQARFASLPPLALGLWLGWLLAYALSAGLLLRGTWQWRRQPALLLLCWGVILYTTFLPGPIAHIRFRVPVAPLLVLLLAAGLPGVGLPASAAAAASDRRSDPAPVPSA